jgi:hypothetical protein
MKLYGVVIHMCMEAMLGICLYSSLYLKLAKTLCLSYYLLHFLFNKIQEEDRICSSQKWEMAQVAQTMYTYVCKCKNDKIKERKKKEHQSIIPKIK